MKKHFINFMFSTLIIFEIEGQSCILNLTCGNDGTYLIDCDSNLVCWEDGYRGHENSFKQSSENIYKKSTNKKFIQISSTNGNTIGIAEDGTLWGWGENINYNLGINESNKITDMIQIGLDSDWKQILVGPEYSVALKKDGTLWTWGLNQVFSAYLEERYIKTPKKIGNSKWYSISLFIGILSADFISIKEDKSLWYWGENDYRKSKERLLSNEKGWSKIVAGNSFWGFGYLGIKNDQLYLLKGFIGIKLELIKMDFKLKVKDISTGNGLVYYIIDENKSLWGFGSNASGGLGLENNKLDNSYKKPVLLDDTKKWKNLFSTLHEFAYIADDQNKIYVIGNRERLPYFIKQIIKQEYFKPTAIEKN